MKKITAILMALVMIAAMTACSFHTHTETENWVADAAGHWKLCGTCGEKMESGSHALNDEARCTVCCSDIMEWDGSVSVFTYDEHQGIVRMADYGADGNLISETVKENEYDADGCLVREKEYVDGAFTYESEYIVIDGESILVRITQYNGDGSKFVNEYDICGNVVVLINYDADGHVNMQSNSRYAQTGDGDWYETACTEVYSDGKKIEAEYDEYGSTTSRVIYEADGSVSSAESWAYTYDENGFTTTEKLYVDGVLDTEIIYRIVTGDDCMYGYPETVITHFADGGRKVCVYNELDELVSETNYDADGNVTG